MNGFSRLAWQAFEILLLAAVVLAPWGFGSVHPPFEFAIVGLVLASCIAGALGWLTESASLELRTTNYWLFLAGLFLLSAVGFSHITTASDSVRAILNPNLDRWQAYDLSLSANAVRTAMPESVNSWRAFERLSLNPFGSYQFALRLLVLGLVISIIGVHSQVSRLAMRFSWALMVVGGTVALVGIAQHFGSHDQKIYWFFETTGLGFGPFINRNHYPFFANLCLGATLALVMRRQEALRDVWYRNLLTDPSLMLLAMVSATIFASLLICGSRGGVGSAVIAGAILATVIWRSLWSKGAPMLAIVTLIFVVSITSWVGFDLFQSRVLTETSVDRIGGDGRWNMWQAALYSWLQFPWIGSGGETFSHWERIWTTDKPSWVGANQMVLRADNEYLDVLSEYGLVGGAALVLMAAAILIHGFRALKRDESVFGLLFGILAVMIHSFVDFGLRVPASALAAMVAVGLLLTARTTRSYAGHRDFRSLHLSDRLQRGIVCGIVLVLAVIVLRERYRDWLSDRWQIAAYQKVAQNDLGTAISLMEEASRVVPENAAIHSECSRLIQMELSHREKLSKDSQSTEDAVLDDLHNKLVLHLECESALMPLSWRPHAVYAGLLNKKDQSDGIFEHLKMAHQLNPIEPNVAFLLGEQYQERGEFDQALAVWRESLTYSRNHLKTIIERIDQMLVEGRIDANDILGLMPADASVTYEGAKYFSRLKTGDQVREALLKRTVELSMEAQRDFNGSLLWYSNATRINYSYPFPMEAYRQSLIMLARAKRDLAEYEESQKAYEEVLRSQPESVNLRRELVEMLIEARMVNEARRQLRVLATMTDRPESIAVLESEVARLLAEQMIDQQRSQ